MEVFKYQRQFFRDKISIFKQISLFSIVGIMVILFNNFSSNYLNMFLDNFYITPPANPLWTTLSLAAAVFIMMYLTGYRYLFINKTLKNDGIIMPEFTLEAFSALILMLPVILAWAVYYLITITVVCFILYKYMSLNAYCVFYSVMLCLLPFVFILFCEFAADFKYKKNYFNPIYLYKILDKTLGDVIILSLEILIPALIAGAIVYGWFYCTKYIKSEILLFGVRYFGIILCAYLLLNLKYLYFTGLAKITKRKLIHE